MISVTMLFDFYKNAVIPFLNRILFNIKMFTMFHLRMNVMSLHAAKPNASDSEASIHDKITAHCSLRPSSQSY